VGYFINFLICGIGHFGGKLLGQETDWREGFFPKFSPGWFQLWAGIGVGNFSSFPFIWGKRGFPQLGKGIRVFKGGW